MTSASDSVSADARDLHRDALVWDMTVPIITPGAAELRDANVARAHASGFDFVSLTMAVDGFDMRAAAKQIARFRRHVLEQPEIAVLASSAAAVASARRDGRIAVGLHFQGTAPFEDDLGLVDVFYELGIRHALMAYNQDNAVGSGCHVEEDKGLTSFGRSLIAEMNRVGMLVDCAHTGYRTMMETVEASSSPVIVSHTNVHALCAHDRCVRDDQIEACARSGGVLGMTGLSMFLGQGRATVERLVDHIDHVAQLVGPQHVGLGLDYVADLPAFESFVATSGSYDASAGYSNMSQIELEDAPRITQELMKRGYSESETRGVLGENWLRVCERVWK